MINKNILEKVKKMTNRDNYIDMEEIIEDLLIEIEYLKDKLKNIQDDSDDSDYYEDNVLGLL